MTIAQAEDLKRSLTDKYVVVQEGVAELRRFSGLTGQVKTVNMSGRALVQFDGPADIGWYDIDPFFLKVVPAPQPKPAKHVEKPAVETKAEKKPAPAPSAGKSPLEMARAQGAAQAGAAPKKLSPLEQARMQGAARTAAPAPVEAAPTPSLEAAAPVAPPETPAPPPAAEAVKPVLGKPGSTAEIIALARQQGSIKK